MMAVRALSEAEVHERTTSYTEPGVTDALYAFGTILLTANRERTKALEDKAMIVAGFAGGILAFLASRDPTDSVMASAPWPPSPVVIAAVLATLALGCAALSLFVQRHAWLSDSQWFENEEGALKNDDILKRCHVLAMHAVNRRMDQSNDLKANFVLAGQFLIVGAGICLAPWLFLR
jgi:hypothetical protein